MVTCGSVVSRKSYACNVTTGTGDGGYATFCVEVLHAAGTPVIYSSTQASTITESGHNSGSAALLNSAHRPQASSDFYSDAKAGTPPRSP